MTAAAAVHRAVVAGLMVLLTVGTVVAGRPSGSLGHRRCGGCARLLKWRLINGAVAVVAVAIASISCMVRLMMLMVLLMVILKFG